MALRRRRNASLILTGRWLSIIITGNVVTAIAVSGLNMAPDATLSPETNASLQGFTSDKDQRLIIATRSSDMSQIHEQFWSTSNPTGEHEENTPPVRAAYLLFPLGASSVLTPGQKLLARSFFTEDLSSAIKRRRLYRLLLRWFGVVHAIQTVLAAQSSRVWIPPLTKHRWIVRRPKIMRRKPVSRNSFATAFGEVIDEYFGQATRHAPGVRLSSTVLHSRGR